MANLTEICLGLLILCFSGAVALYDGGGEKLWSWRRIELGVVSWSLFVTGTVLLFHGIFRV